MVLIESETKTEYIVSHGNLTPEDLYEAGAYIVVFGIEKELTSTAYGVYLEDDEAIMKKLSGWHLEPLVLMPGERVMNRRKLRRPDSITVSL